VVAGIKVISREGAGGPSVELLPQQAASFC
jgi:hypothetical protein